MHHDLKAVRATLQAAQTVNEFAEWLRADADRLLDAVELLGGRRWKARAEIVLNAVSDGSNLRKINRELSELLALLSLELTVDLDSDEAALFMSIHPDDPRADDARLCTEALQRGLAALKQFEAMTQEVVA
jgi:hypothetical protein